ncbi:MAG TPA: DUF4838 domain-containing protein [Tepidisphaeraceae bacterium]|nr:DUF4838 domain-containing protein [Tepidisphaeraceae bacterium]
MQTTDHSHRDTGVPPVLTERKGEKRLIPDAPCNRRGRDARVTVSVGVLLALLVTPHLLIAEQWHNTLKPKGVEASSLTLVRDGEPLYSIELPEKPTGPEKKAADDLRQWIREMTGAELPLAASPVAKSIRLTTNPDAPDEQYTIAVNGETLILSGGPGRGVVNAVYALLEEDLGCRWYAKDSFRLPRSETLSIAPVTRTYAPKLKLRDPFYKVSFDPDWSLRNRTNAPDAHVPENHGGRMDYGGLFVHTHAALLPVDPHFKEHPEYFAQDASGNRYAAQLCPTHPQVARIVTANVLAALKNHPDAEIVSVSKNDNAGDQICHCPRCTELRTAEGGTDMANQLYLVNQVAEAVERAHPKVVVDTLAYLETIYVPTTIRPRKNVAIRLCNDTVGAWAKPFTPAEQLPVAALTKSWSKVHDRLYIWDYNVNFSHYLAPMPNVGVIASNIRFWIDNKAEGVMTQGGYQGPAERDELKSWVIAKLMWDPSLDENALKRDFILGHYGAAAPALMEYDALLREQAESHAAALQSPPGGIRYPMDIAFLTKDFCDRAAAIFARGRELAGSNEALLHRVERAELPILYVQLSRGSAFAGPDYAGMIDRFERIARREGAAYMMEAPANLDATLAAWRKAEG